MTMKKYSRQIVWSKGLLQQHVEALDWKYYYRYTEIVFKSFRNYYFLRVLN